MVGDKLAKFRQLPRRIQSIVSGQEAMTVISELEKKFQVKLSLLVLRVAIREIKLDNLVNALQSELIIEPAAAQEIAQVLKEKIFSRIVDNKAALRSREEIVDDIVNQVDVDLDDHVLKKRFKKIILLRLKDIRDNLETFDTLARPIKIGGMGLEERVIEKILAIVKKEMEELSAEEMEKIKREEEEKKIASLPKKTGPADLPGKSTEKREQLPPPVPMVIKKKRIDFSEKPAPPQEKPDPIPHPRQEIKQAHPRHAPARIKQQPEKKQRRRRPEWGGADIPKEQKPVVRPKRPTVHPVAQESPMTAARERVSPPSSTRPKIEDIKFVSKLTGPLDELLRLNLVDFRRLAGDPKQATQKIEQKLDLLEEDSLTKRLDGIKNFKASQLYKLYLKIGQQSLRQKRPIEDVIKMMESNGQPTLKKEEFEAVMELNDRLRY